MAYSDLSLGFNSNITQQKCELTGATIKWRSVVDHGDLLSNSSGKLNLRLTALSNSAVPGDGFTLVIVGRPTSHWLDSPAGRTECIGIPRGASFRGDPALWFLEHVMGGLWPCRGSDPAERSGYAAVASLAMTKDIGTRPSRGGEVASNLRLEDLDAERGLTQPAVFNRLEGCSTKDIAVRPARVGNMDDGTALFTDPKEVSLSSTGSIGGTIQGLIEFNHVGR